MDYLEHHLDNENIRLENLAEVAHLSRFHFERMYVEKVKETPMATVRRLRLKRARKLLLEGTSPSITALALMSGYGSVAAFSRAFSRTFDQSPTGVIALPPQSDADVGDVRDLRRGAPVLELVALPAVPVERHPFTGRAADVFNAGDEFAWFIKCSGTYPLGYRHWVVHPDGWIDPARNPETWVRMWHCTPVNPVLPRVPGADRGFLPSGMYARFVLLGNVTADIPKLMARVARETSWKVVDGAMLRFYPTVPHYTPTSERIPHFYLPVVP